MATPNEKAGLDKTSAITDELREEMDTTNPAAIREAARLGQTDAYFVESDFEDIDQREGKDQEDGRASPLANADNPEK
ncbi:MAG: hypothetical protein PW791_06200 [Neorhizobium sp.]|nr:hypothetical protein [Neorhizobium sp.]